MPSRADSETGPGSARPLSLGCGCVVYYAGASVLILLLCFAALKTAKSPGAYPPPARFFAALFSSLVDVMWFVGGFVALIVGSLLVLRGLGHRVRLGVKFNLRHVLIAILVLAFPLASPYAATPFVVLILFQGPMILACLAAFQWSGRDLVAREPLPPRGPAGEGVSTEPSPPGAST